MSQLKLPISDLSIIKKFLPHREPMIMIDSLIEHTAEGCISELSILESNLFVENGHFSEAGIIEHMAQTAALHVGYKYSRMGQEPREGYIAAIQKAEFHRLPKIGEKLTSEMKIIFDSDEIKKVLVSTSVGTQLIATASMTTVLKKNS